MTEQTQPEQPESTTTEGEDVNRPADLPEPEQSEPKQHKLPDTTDDDTGQVDPEPADDSTDEVAQGGKSDADQPRWTTTTAGEDDGPA